jgi:hypothetical protein
VSGGRDGRVSPKRLVVWETQPGLLDRPVELLRRRARPRVTLWELDDPDPALTQVLRCLPEAPRVKRQFHDAVLRGELLDECSRFECASVAVEDLAADVELTR